MVNEIAQLSRRVPNLQIGLDDTDVGGWPFIWYFRHDPNVTETSIFSGPIRPSAWTVHDAGVDDPQPADTKTASEETSLHRCLFGYPCTDR